MVSNIFVDILIIFIFILDLVLEMETGNGVEAGTGKEVEVGTGKGVGAGREGGVGVEKRRVGTVPEIEEREEEVDQETEETGWFI